MDEKWISGIMPKTNGQISITVAAQVEEAVEFACGGGRR